MKNTVSNLMATGVAWEAFTLSLGDFSAKDTEENAQSMMSLLDRLLEFAAVHKKNPPLGVTSLIGFVTDWITAYEERHIQIAESDPLELLRHLMDANGLKQVDLAAEFGGQSVVSAVLRGERKINLRQAHALGNRFDLDFSSFISPVDVAASGLAEPFIANEIVGVTDSSNVLGLTKRNKQWLTRPNCSVTKFKTRKFVTKLRTTPQFTLPTGYSVNTLVTGLALPNSEQMGASTYTAIEQLHDHAVVA